MYISGLPHSTPNARLASYPCAETAGVAARQGLEKQWIAHLPRYSRSLFCSTRLSG